MTLFQIFELMISDLRKLDSSFAVRLLAQVEERIDERRLKVASTLLAYLEDPTFLEQDDLILPYATKSQLTSLARDIYFRHHHVPKPVVEETERQDTPEENPDEPEVVPTPPKKSRSNEWRQKIQDKRAKIGQHRHSDHTSGTLLTAIKNEIKEYEHSGKRPEKLHQVNWFREGKS